MESLTKTPAGPSEVTAQPAGDSGPTRPRRIRAALAGPQLERYGLVILLVIEVAIFSLLRPDTYATVANWQAMATSQAVLGVAALALVVPLVGGRFDVSVGSNLGLCGVVCAGLMSRNGLGLVPAIAVTLLIGSGIGLINGVIVAYRGVNSIIATLGTGTIMGGIVEGYSHGLPISGGISTTLSNLSAKMFLGVPYLFILMILIAVGVWFLLTQTPYGRYLTAAGSNSRAARLTGVNVGRTVLLSFVASGFLAACAGILEIGATGDADPSVTGIAFIVPALAAVFLGGTTITPGKYNVPGAIIALFFLASTVSGLVLIGVSPWVTDVFDGAAVVVAIIIAAALRRQRTGLAEVGT